MKKTFFVLSLALFLLGTVWGAVSLAQEPTPVTADSWLAPPVTTAAMPARVAPTALLTTTEAAFLPLLVSPPNPNIWIDTTDRAAVVEAYREDYLGSENNNSGWSGNHANCEPGTTTAAFRNSILMRLNYFRRMAGIPPLEGLNDEYNRKAQEAALMMSANGALSHDPPNNWLCYTADGDQAAGSSNLFLGVYGPAAISGYMVDPGGGNYFVGHRRWILYPQTRFMGTGDIPAANGQWSSNALWVFDANRHPIRPDTRENYVAWPPPGYVPYQIIYSRWSFAVAGADFSQAQVSMTRNGAAVPLTVNPIANGFGENTLVWEPTTTISQPSSDVVFWVTIENVFVSGSSQTFVYEVIMIDPN